MFFLNHAVSALILFSLIWTVKAEGTPSKAPKKYCSGVFINRINKFDLLTGSAEVDFWYWTVSESPKVSLQNLEIINGTFKTNGETIKQELGGRHYVSRRYTAVVKCKIDTAKFPFDKQVIPLIFEDSEQTLDQLIFVPDKVNSGIDPSFRMNNWVIRQINYKNAVHHYPSSFGYLNIPSGQGSDYSQLVVEIEIGRRGSILHKILKYFWAMAISVLVGMFALLIPIHDLAARFGMATGSLFANVGCSYLLSEQLPKSPTISLAEAAGYVSLGLIMFSLLVSIFSLMLFNNEFKKGARRLDWTAFTISMSSYIVMWIYIVSN